VTKEATALLQHSFQRYFPLLVHGIFLFAKGLQLTLGVGIESSTIVVSCLGKDKLDQARIRVERAISLPLRIVWL